MAKMSFTWCQMFVQTAPAKLLNLLLAAAETDKYALHTARTAPAADSVVLVTDTAPQLHSHDGCATVYVCNVHVCASVSKA